jgi:RNA polymerase sigma-70 factor, ECF subfamily
MGANPNPIPTSDAAAGCAPRQPESRAAPVPQGLTQSGQFIQFDLGRPAHGSLTATTEPILSAQPLSAADDLNEFLKSVERRAFKRTVYAVRDEDAALDIVQEAMIRLTTSYSERPSNEWPMLFQRIVSNATLDWFRRQKVRKAVFTNMSDLEASVHADDDGDFDLLEVLKLDIAGTEGADDTANRNEILAQIEEEIGHLPARQREAFLLRYWEELDVAKTAAAMGCSEGSVKTHCSRAVASLAKALTARGIRL